MTTTERENRMEKMRIEIPEGDNDRLRKVVSEAMDALVDYAVPEIITHGDVYAKTVKSLMRFKQGEEGFYDEKALCRVALLTTHAYYMLGIIYDRLNVRNEDLLDVRFYLFDFLHSAETVKFHGLYHGFKLSNVVAGHNRVFKSYLESALKEKGMEEDIDIELSSYIVSYSSIIDNLVKEYHYLLATLGFEKPQVL